MKPPLRSEDHDEVTAKAVLACGNNQSSCSGMDVRAFFGKYINALMRNRFAPGICPEGILVIAMAGRTLHRHRGGLGGDPAGSQGGCKKKTHPQAGGKGGGVFFFFFK